MNSSSLNYNSELQDIWRITACVEMVEIAEVCEHCSELIPPKTSSLVNVEHHANIGLLRQSSFHCFICKVIIEDCQLRHVKDHFWDVDESTFDQMPLTMRLTEARTFGSGLDLGQLRVELEYPQNGHVFSYVFSMTTCNSNCRLPVYLPSFITLTAVQHS